MHSVISFGLAALTLAAGVRAAPKPTNQLVPPIKCDLVYEGTPPYVYVYLSY